MNINQILTETKNKITIEIALVFCNRTPRANSVYDCALCPFHYDCQTIKKAKEAFNQIEEAFSQMEE